MVPGLAGAAFLMGALGGPHCLAMCGAACAGVLRNAPQRRATWTFHGGRLLGYAAAGAVAGLATETLGWLSASSIVLRPAWTVFHAAVLLWGLMLLAQARQPAWVERAGRGAWARVRPLAQRRGGLLATGALWAFLPCGLLYSALLLASLSGGALGGAGVMASFAVGSGVFLVGGGAALQRLRQRAGPGGRAWGARAAGLLLAAMALFALWTDVAHAVAAWCGPA